MEFKWWRRTHILGYSSPFLHVGMKHYVCLAERGAPLKQRHIKSVFHQIEWNKNKAIGWFTFCHPMTLQRHIIPYNTADRERLIQQLLSQTCNSDVLKMIFFFALTKNTFPKFSLAPCCSFLFLILTCSRSRKNHDNSDFKCRVCRTDFTFMDRKRRRKETSTVL